jgi:XTP/dITP diphosphohydrolase
MELLLASNNRGKAREFKRLFNGHTIILPEERGARLSSHEEGSTFLENALGKAQTLYSLTKKPVVADDSGLCVTALDGRPGIYSSRFGLQEKGHLLTDSERNEFLLSLLKNKSDRQAFFVCCMVLVLSTYRFFAAEETLSGEIARKQTGGKGFGYDPVFFLPSTGKTVAELDDHEKDTLSHRGKAARCILTIINSMEL